MKQLILKDIPRPQKYWVDFDREDREDYSFQMFAISFNGGAYLDEGLAEFCDIVRKAYWRRRKILDCFNETGLRLLLYNEGCTAVVEDRFSVGRYTNGLVRRLRTRRHPYGTPARYTEGVKEEDEHNAARLAEALQYAAHVHAQQKRKSTDIPYIGHLLGVASIVIDAGGDTDEAIAALLHDAPEDQGAKEQLHAIHQRFGDRVADIVQACSDPLASGGKNHALSYDERKRAYLEHLRACDDKSVYLVSIADKLRNARATLLDLRSDHKVWTRFNAERAKILDNYDALLKAYQEGPADARRVPLTEELAETLAALGARSEAADA